MPVLITYTVTEAGILKYLIFKSFNLLYTD
ncbi:hypothetical protein SASC598P14_012960 [Snodgrassella alvi SCGC AB-598-P14]|nr:hypothetical protein SASC598P14_012960 [Snodgrassella alvi SCGC AB-598-P14]